MLGRISFGMVSSLLYRRREMSRPQVLSIAEQVYSAYTGGVFAKLRYLSIMSLLMLFASQAPGEEVLMSGGRSPGGGYEIWMSPTAGTEAGNSLERYSIQLRDAARTSSLFTLARVSGSNDVEYEVAKERSRALWQPSGRFVAITDQSSRFSRSVYILSVRDGQVEQVRIPDYVQNALGRVKATEIYHDCVSIPKAWSGDELSLTLYFSALGAPQYLYSCEVVLRLDQDGKGRPEVLLKSISEPIANEN